MRYLFVLNELPFPAHRNGVALINYQVITRAPPGVEIDLLISDVLDVSLESEFRKVAPSLGTVTYVGRAGARRYRVGNLLSGALFGRCAFEVRAAVEYLKHHGHDYDAVYIAPLMSFVDPGRVRHTLMNAVDSFARFNDNAYRGTGSAIDFSKRCLYGLYEKKVLRHVARTSFVSRVDADYVLKRSNDLQIVATPNGVDTEYFAPGLAEREPFSILFTGNFSYTPNAEAVVYFAREVLPIIMQRYPGALFYAVGPHSPPELGDIPGVVATGFVDDIREYYQRCSVFVCPLLGGAGIKNKVLEAMSCGIPIVTTRLGMDGIEGTAVNEHYFSAESIDEFADRIGEMWERPSDAQAVAAAARMLVASRMTWRAVAGEYFRHLDEVARANGSVSERI